MIEILPIFEPAAMWNLRVAATMAAALPVRVVVADGDRTILEVMRPPLPVASEHPVLSPCWFRSMVVQARSGVYAITGPLMDSLEHADALSVRVTLAHSGDVLPGGVCRLDHHDESVYVLASELPAAGVRQALCDGDDDREGMTGIAAPPAVSCLEDRGTAVTLVSATFPPVAEARPGAVDVDVVHSLLARCRAVELIEDLDARSDEGGGGQSS